MSVFKLTRRMCKEIASLMVEFWWGHMHKEIGIYWKNWIFLGETKSLEGLGFKDLEAFNKTLLAKQI